MFFAQAVEGAVHPTFQQREIRLHGVRVPEGPAYIPADPTPPPFRPVTRLTAFRAPWAPTPEPPCDSSARTGAARAINGALADFRFWG